MTRCSLTLGIIGLTLATAACAAQEDLGDRSGDLSGADAASPSPTSSATPTPTPTPTPDGSTPDSSTPVPSKVVLFGGFDNSGNQLGDTWIWDGASWTQASPATVPPARSFASGATLGGQVMMFGGEAAATLADTWTWDGTNWTQHSVTGPSARFQAAAATSGGQIILYGGDDLDDTDTWSWNGSAWTALPNANGPDQPLDWSGTTFNGQPLLVGNGGLVQFDGTEWNSLGAQQGGPDPDGGQSVATLGSNVVLFGGEGENFNSLDQTWTWDGTNWTLRNTKGPSGRQMSAMASANGTLVLFGGCIIQFDAPSICTGDTWTFDGTTWTEHNVPGPSARGGAFMAAE